MKLKISNWRDEEGSELEKAKRLLSNKEVSVKEISKLTNLKYQTLVNYRQDLKKLDKASWQTINKLSQFYDAYEISHNVSQEDFLKINAALKDMFDEWREAYADFPDNIKVADAIERIIATDPNAMYVIYKALL